MVKGWDSPSLEDKLKYQLEVQETCRHSWMAHNANFKGQVTSLKCEFCEKILPTKEWSKYDQL